MPAQAATVHPGHTEIGDEGYGFGGGGASRFHVADYAFSSFNQHANANLFHAETFFVDGQGGQHVWSFSGQRVRSYETIRELLRDGRCDDGGQPPVEVSNVPVPNAVWLFLSAIALLFGISFSRRTVKD